MRGRFAFKLSIDGKPTAGELRFSRRSELRSYHRSVALSHGTMTMVARDAIEFTRLAAKRWRYYASAGEVAESFAALKQAMRRNPQCEIAFILIAWVKLESRDVPIGLAYCRRTWCHHLALDFLALHPRTFSGEHRIFGAGSGIVFGLVELATLLGIRRIWGEATASSAPFYERLLAVRPVRDLFVIDDREAAAIRRRQK